MTKRSGLFAVLMAIGCMPGLRRRRWRPRFHPSSRARGPRRSKESRSTAARSRATSKAIPRIETCWYFFLPAIASSAIAAIRSICAAWLFDRRRAMVGRNPRPADDRRSIRVGVARNDRRAAGFENRTQRIDVFELRHHRRFREFHRARPGGLHRQPTTAHCRNARVADSSVTPWAAMARRASA